MHPKINRNEVNDIPKRPNTPKPTKLKIREPATTPKDYATDCVQLHLADYSKDPDSITRQKLLNAINQLEKVDPISANGYRRTVQFLEQQALNRLKKR